MSKSSIAKKVQAFKFGQLVMTELGINYTTLTAIELKAMTERELTSELQHLAIYLAKQEDIILRQYLLDQSIDAKSAHIKITEVIDYIALCLRPK